MLSVIAASEWISCVRRCLLASVALYVAIILCVVPGGAVVQVDGSYDTAAAAALSGLAFPGLVPRTLADGTANDTLPEWHVSLLRRPAALSAEAYVSVPLLAAPVCVAYNLSRAAGLEASTAQLGAVLRGAGDVRLSSAASAAVVMSGDVRIVIAPPEASASSAALLGRLVDDGVAGFAERGAWPADVLASARVVVVADEAAVVAAVKGGRGLVAAVPLAAGVGLPCARLRVTHPFTLIERGVRPYLPADAASQLAVEVGEPPAVAATGDAYPLVGALVLSVRRQAGCAAASAAHAFAARVLGDEGFVAPLLPWGFGRLGARAGLAALVRLVPAAACSNVSVAAAGGSSAIAGAASAWSLRYLLRTNVLVAYVPDGSGAGKAGVMGGSRRIAGSDSLLSAAERAAHPAVRLTPAVAFAASIVFNLDGVDRLVLPRCAVVRMFNGTLTRWSDAELQAANPAVVLPDLPIAVAVRGTKSGTTEVFTTGLRALDEACNGAAGASVRVTSTWELPAAVAAESTGAMLRAVQATPGAVGYVASGAARALRITEATLFDERSESITEPSVSFVQNALSRGSVDAATGAVAFPRDAASYPFVGITSFVVDTRAAGNCSATRAALEWARFAYSAEGQALAAEADFVPLSEGLAAAGRAVLESVECAGVPLYPRAAETSDDESGSTALWAAVGAVAGLAALGVALQGVRAARGGGARDVRFAPTDDTRPFTVAFTDVQASTLLWALAPEEMGPALDAHHALMRELIAAHRGFEVKTIGDSFMVAFRAAGDAAAFALGVQEAFHAARWAGALERAYREQLAEQFGALEDTAATRELLRQLEDAEAYGRLWGGLRVRVGVHHGLGDIRYDDVARSYDYYGTVVNTAARVESVAHGGQVLLTRAAAEAAWPGGAAADAPGVVVTELGAVELRGLPEEVVLVQALPGALAGRRFPALRLERAGSVDDSIISGSQSDLSTQAQSMYAGSDAGGLRTAFSVEGLAGELVPRDAAPGAVAELLNAYGYTEALLRPLKAGERGAVLEQLKKAWRIDARGGARLRHYGDALGAQPLDIMRLAQRANDVWATRAAKLSLSSAAASEKSSVVSHSRRYRLSSGYFSPAMSSPSTTPRHRSSPGLTSGM